jgi:hypothetical protein
MGFALKEKKMRRISFLLRVFYFLTLLLTLLGVSHVGLAAKPIENHFQKIVWIVFENTNYKKALKQADFAKWATKGALFTNMNGEVHPSQGNYISMVAGSAFNIKSDKNIDLDKAHIGDLLEQNGLTWGAYAEEYPGNCFTGASSAGYVRKHNPFISFKNVSQNLERCKNIESINNFFNDLNGGNLPNYSIYVPNLDNDGHDTGVDYAGKWLTKTFAPIFSNLQKYPDVVFGVTFDESSSFIGNHIYTVLLGASVKPGSVNKQKIGHPTFLKMFEDELRLGNLGQKDSTAESINDIWN